MSRPTLPPPPPGFSPEEIAAQIAAFEKAGGKAQVVPVVERAERDNLPRHFVISAEKVKMKVKNRVHLKLGKGKP